MRSTTAIMIAGLAVLVVTGSVKAEIITDETFTSNTDFDAAAPSDWFVETTATWTINPGVTVTVGNGNLRPRFFVDSNTAPNGDATWTITGGGTVSQDITGYAACRLGHSGGTHGTVIIEGGSTYRIINWGPFFASYANSGSLEINGAGSTFSAKGAYTPITETTGTFLAASNCVAGVNDVLVSFSGGSPEVTDLGDGFTQLSVAGTAPDAVGGVVGVNTIKLDVTGSVGSLKWQASEDNITWSDIIPLEVGYVVDVTSLYTNTPWFRVEAVSGSTTNYSAAMHVVSDGTPQGTVIYIR